MVVTQVQLLPQSKEFWAAVTPPRFYALGAATQIFIGVALLFMIPPSVGLFLNYAWDVVSFLSLLCYT